MRLILTIIAVFISVALLATQIKSVIGARGIEYAETIDVPPLPEGLTAVRYLESTGTQFIDTRIDPSNYLKWSADIKCLPRSESAFMSLIGYDYDSLGSQSVGINRWKWAKTDISVDYMSETHIIADETGQYFNGVQGNSINIGKGNLYLFNRTKYLNQYPWVGIIYGCKICIDNIIVRDFVPIRFTNENEAEEGAMYDFVSEQLFRNNGTGSFIIGPDL